MKIKKVIEIHFGCCSESVIWEVGADFCTIIGTYPEAKKKYLKDDLIGDTIAWKFLLDSLGEKIK